MSDTKRLRRPSEGGYVRGDETRLRIIVAAIESFGEHGFDGASTREIAARAGVNAPALQYYFENKEGVYRACAEYMADEAAVNFEPVVAHANRVLENNAAVPLLIDAFIRIQEAIADRMFAKGCGTTNHRLFFAREQVGHEPSIATEILTRRVRQPLNDVTSRLMARITGTTADDPVTLIRMISLNGQLLMFHVAPRTSLGLLGWTEIDAEKGEFLKRIVREQTRTLLEKWARETAASERKGKGALKLAARPAARKRSATAGATKKAGKPA
ncbi:MULTISPECIES: CerR family C-terminal domain-containing protein [Burkholderiaceae]|uniref:Transcriptional regulator YbiH, TetR family n=1 Tax=Caballeronia sordidicola TaxID=196367 RepID=A0A242MS22_CABSO|nr:MULTISPECIES: CerR family C-terminal domain-containing protein [Burkholderiaceae]AMH43233.1 TetR family transcriptional regulator [Burkholderia sp. PAMC 26561]OTP74149.1 Transcriptional regulator YbiH, TetR family [Caballeronia sordidicola]